MQIAPSGLKYCDVEQVIENIASAKARQHSPISYLNEEDLKQEIRIKCIKVIKKYDPTRHNSNLISFLSISADNHLRDLRRSLVYNPNNKPSYSNDRVGSSLVFEHKEELNFDGTSSHSVQKVDIYDYILSKLPSGLMPIYHGFHMAGFDFKALPPGERNLLLSSLLDIVRDIKEDFNG